MNEILMLGVFLTVATVVFALTASLRRRVDRHTERRLTHLMTSPAAEHLPRDTALPWRDTLAAQLPQPDRSTNRIRYELLQAGYYHSSALSWYLAVRNGLMLLVLLGTGVVTVMLGPTREPVVLRVVLIGLAATILLWAASRAMLQALARQRVRRLTQSLPFALDLITMCLSGGASLGESLKHVTREITSSHPDLADELAIVQRQSELATLEFALRQFAVRIDAPEVMALASLIQQNQVLGTDIAQAVEEYADNLRTQWRQTADERANRATVLALLPLVFCLLPAVVIVLWGPAILELAEFFSDLDRHIPPPPDLPRG